MSTGLFAARVPLARRQLLHEPLKLGLALGGVALAVALVGLLLGLREGINRQATTFEDHAGADIYVGATDARTFVQPGASALPVSLGSRIGMVPGVAEVAPISNGLTILSMHHMRLATMVVGFDPGRLGGPWKMSRGRAPTGQSEIAVDRVMADAHSIRVGDTVQLRGLPLLVVGLTDRTASWMTPLLFVTRRTANVLQRQGDIATFFLVRVSRRDRGEVTRELARRFPALRVMTRDQISRKSRQLMTEAFNPTLMSMVLIALGIGALVIGLTAYGFVSERRREYGALKAIGDRDGHLYRLVSAQALAIALAGLLAGVIVARVAAWGIHSAWPKFLFVSLPSHYTLLVIATLAMGLLGAVVPVRLLARLDPAEVFRA